MNAPLAVLAGSLLLNVAGISALLLRPAFAPPAVRDFLSQPIRPDVAAPAPPAAVRASKPAAPKRLWPTLDAGGDLPTLVRRLRQAGFPAEIIRAMIMAELGARYDTRIRALFEPDAGTPFWKAGSSILTTGDNRMEVYGQLQRERAKVQRELFADPFFATDDVSAAQRRQFGQLPRQKIDLLQRIEDDYAEMGAAIRSTTNGILLPEDREKLALLSRERRADLAAVLSPEELADYEVRSSPITSMLARQLGGFNPSDAEFRAIFQAQLAFGERLGPGAFSGSFNPQDRQAATQQLNDQLKASLGAARYADYLRETDSTYQQLARLVQRENLPADTALRAFNVRDKVAAESGRIVDDPALDPEQKRAALQSLADRTRTELLAMLGPNAGPTYIKVIEPRWLNGVQRGNAVSFTSASGSSLMGFSGGSSTPFALSFGQGPTFRSVTRPNPAPRNAPAP